MASSDPKALHTEAETLADKTPTEPTDSQKGQTSENPDRASGQSMEEAAMERGNEGEVEEDDEEGECGFCLFMKGGGCRESFIAWEECIQEAEKNKEDIVSKCMDVTANLKKCMEAHSDYYEPILRAEKAAEEEAKQELEKEKAAEQASANSGTAEKKPDSGDR